MGTSHIVPRPFQECFNLGEKCNPVPERIECARYGAVQRHSKPSSKQDLKRCKLCADLPCSVAGKFAG